MACSLGLGIGVTAYPQWANFALWPCTTRAPGLRSLRDAIIIVLSSGLTLGTIVVCILNLLLPLEKALTVPGPPPKASPRCGLSPEPTVHYRAPAQQDIEDPSVKRVSSDEEAA